MIAWDVFITKEEDGSIWCELIDTVFYNEDVEAQEVYKALVNHDGYDPKIVVRNDSIHKDLCNSYSNSLEDYCYETDQDLEEVESRYVYPKDNWL